MIWIAIDNDLLGVSYCFWHLGEDWPRRYYWIFGWRLIALAVLEASIGISVFCFIRAAISSGSTIRLVIGLAVLSLMAVAFVFQRPKFHPYFKWQMRKRAISACRALGHVVQQFEDRKTFDEFTDAAEYATREGWSPRHPRGAGPWWPEVVPVAYVRRDGGTSVIFPVDWELFIGWKLPRDFVLPPNCLPFEGPQGSKFTLTKVVPLKRYPGWTILYAQADYGELDRRVDDAA
ncbi:MAG TPA: hypothetical protein VHE81_02495 [Lacipirellulaceae bacterium]|nr:hypothetical protein [Lacipirellulaceae bacterium]